MDFAQQKRSHQMIVKSGATLDDATIHSIPIHVQEWTNPIAADPDGIISSFGSTAGTQTLTTLNGALASGGTVTLSPPRNVVLVLSNHSDWDATTAVVTGTDITGAVMTEDIAIPNGGNTTVVGVKAFATVVSLFIPAQTSTGGTGTFGTGSRIGLNRKLKVRQGGCCVVYEINAGARVSVVEASYSTPTIAPPYGAYIPSSTIPDGTRDYCVAYEVDMT